MRSSVAASNPSTSAAGDQIEHPLAAHRRASASTEPRKLVTITAIATVNAVDATIPANATDACDGAPQRRAAAELERDMANGHMSKRRNERAGEPRHEHHATGQQQRHRHVAEQRDTAHRGQQRSQERSRQACDRTPWTRTNAWIDGVAGVLDRQRREDARGRQRGNHAAEDRRADFKQPEDRRRPGSGRRVAARCRESNSPPRSPPNRFSASEARPSPSATPATRSDHTQYQGLGEHLSQHPLALHAQDAEQCELRAPPCTPTAS